MYFDKAYTHRFNLNRRVRYDDETLAFYLEHELPTIEPLKYGVPGGGIADALIVVSGDEFKVSLGKFEKGLFVNPGGIGS